MQIAEREVGAVTVLDLSGRITLGEGDTLLKDKLHSLLHQGKKNLLLNLGQVSYVDSAGLGALVSAYTTVTREGGNLKLRQHHQEAAGSALDYEAAHRVRDVRHGRRGDEEFSITKIQQIQQEIRRTGVLTFLLFMVFGRPQSGSCSFPSSCSALPSNLPSS